MTFSNDTPIRKENMELLKDIRIAICGNLPTTCRALRDMGISRIDKYDDGINACFKLRRGEKYHMILVYAPQGEGLEADMPYKIRCDGEWQSVPIKLLNEPACSSALLELESAVWYIARNQLDCLQENSG